MSRAKQRENRRVKAYEIKQGIRDESGEEKLELYDFCGIKDPTPYNAVNNIMRRSRSGAVSR